MKKYLIILILAVIAILLTIFCINTFKKADDSKPLNIYIFSGSGCPHCEAELEALSKIEKDYNGKVKIYNYETWYNEENKALLYKVADRFKVELKGVPFTVIEDEYLSGFMPTTEQKIRDIVDEKLKTDERMDIVQSIIDETK